MSKVLLSLAMCFTLTCSTFAQDESVMDAISSPSDIVMPATALEAPTVPGESVIYNEPMQNDFTYQDAPMMDASMMEAPMDSVMAPMETSMNAPCCDAPAPVCTCCKPAPKTRKRLRLVDVKKEVCRLKRVCVTDECGCTKKKLVRVKECVTRKRLRLVDVEVDPCKKGCLAKLRDRLASLKDRCKSNCNCDACCN